LKGLKVDKCFILQSNTKPLWLVFEDIDGQVVNVIFKVGDDLRVDMIALQLMRILDGLWKREGLDLHLQPYTAIPIGKNVGMIAVVSKSETVSNINWKYGGSSLASAFSSTTIKTYLCKHNPVKSDRERALRNFALSCAGYCVFTYLFGVGDRHDDNILCSKSGNMFHIDFGYFLGQRTKFLGFSRETCFFVLTQNYVCAMDGYFELFMDLSCQGFAIAQKYGQLFQTILKLMIPCGSDIFSPDQIQYLENMFEPGRSESQHRLHFHQLIRKSLEDKRTLLNNLAHLIAKKT
jgi:phosphatidylinositol-4,5-bisphosphate 3-kinase